MQGVIEDPPSRTRDSVRLPGTTARSETTSAIESQFGSSVSGSGSGASGSGSGSGDGGDGGGAAAGGSVADSSSDGGYHGQVGA